MTLSAASARASASSIRNILIVGGGTAGWITASLLRRFLRSDRYTITLVESPTIPTIGVGEATVPKIVNFLRVLGIDPTEFLLRCDASFKLGIRFVDWQHGDDAFWHPFGPIGGSIDEVSVFHHWHKLHRTGRDASSFDSYSLQALLSENGKAPGPLDGESIVTQHGTYAYHLDAAAFAALLAERAEANGVRRILDDVRDVSLDEQGSIRSVETERSGALSADLFIDCTGFRGLLIERALEEPWLDWSDQLLCDRAAVLSTPPDGDMPPYTEASALPAGWIWRIPLYRRVSCGYVYGSRFTSDEDAQRELLARTKADPGQTEIRRLEFRVGRRARFWTRNCVSIGLSSGFLEPLESTGIFLALEGVSELVRNFPDTAFDERLIRRYNERIGRVYEEVRDFVVLHYLLSRREDTEFWKASRNVPASDRLRETLELYDHTGHIDWEHHAIFGDTSFHAIAAGMGRLPVTVLPQTDFSDAEKTLEVLGRIKAQNQGIMAKLPEHAQVLDAVRRAQG